MGYQLVNMDILVVLVGSFILLWICAYALRGVKLRTIPTVEASLEAVRVCAEKGTPLLFDSGWTGANFWGHSTGLTTLCFVPSTLELLKAITTDAGRLGVRVITGTTESVYALMSKDYMQAGFTIGGHPEMFNPDDINFYPDNTALILNDIEYIRRYHIGAAVMVALCVQNQAMSGPAQIAQLLVPDEIGAVHAAASLGIADHRVRCVQAIAEVRSPGNKRCSDGEVGTD